MFVDGPIGTKNIRLIGAEAWTIVCVSNNENLFLFKFRYKRFAIFNCARGFFFFICGFIVRLFGFVSFRWCWVYLFMLIVNHRHWRKKANPSKTSSTKYMLCFMPDNKWSFVVLEIEENIFYYSLDFVMPFLPFFL